VARRPRTSVATASPPRPGPGARPQPGPDDDRFDRVAAVAAVLVAVLSLAYAVAYLAITPSAQRGSDIDAFYRSYIADPTGARIASTCLLLSGLLVGLPVVALARRLTGREAGFVAWAAVVGVVGGLATAAHGLSGLLGVDKLAHRYASGDAATRAAVAVAGVTPSEVDPRGLATFCLAGLVALAFGMAIRHGNRRLGLLGAVLGVDMVVLFLATAVGVGPLVLLTGGLASVVLGPLWWISLGRALWSPQPIGTAPAGTSTA
jgi:hypothetical protein